MNEAQVKNAIAITAENLPFARPHRDIFITGGGSLLFHIPVSLVSCWRF